MPWAQPAELAVGVVDQHQVGEDLRAVAVLALDLVDDDLLLVGQTLQGPHRRLEDGLGVLLGVPADLRQHGRVLALQARVQRAEFVALPLRLGGRLLKGNVSPAQGEVRPAGLEGDPDYYEHHHDGDPEKGFLHK